MSAPVTDDQIAEANKATEANLVAQGLPTHDEIEPEIYWGYDFNDRWEFPDHVQFIEFKRMNEGMKVEFQRKTNRKVKVGRVTGDAEMSVDPAGDRKILIQLCVTGWKLYKRNHKNQVVEAAFSQQSLAEWMADANPLFVEQLEKAIREANPWMKQEMTVESIDAEIASLTEQRVEAEKREREKATS